MPDSKTPLPQISKITSIQDPNAGARMAANREWKLQIDQQIAENRQRLEMERQRDKAENFRALNHENKVYSSLNPSPAHLKPREKAKPEPEIEKIPKDAMKKIYSRIPVSKLAPKIEYPKLKPIEAPKEKAVVETSEAKHFSVAVKKETEKAPLPAKVRAPSIKQSKKIEERQKTPAAKTRKEEQKPNQRIVTEQVKLSTKPAEPPAVARAPVAVAPKIESIAAQVPVPVISKPEPTTAPKLEPKERVYEYEPTPPPKQNPNPSNPRRIQKTLNAGPKPHQVFKF